MRWRRGWDFALTKGKIEQFKAEYGVLAWPVHHGTTAIQEVTEVELAGWITRERFAAICESWNYGHGKCLRVKPDQLYGMSTLRLIVAYLGRDSEE